MEERLKGAKISPMFEQGQKIEERKRQEREVNRLREELEKRQIAEGNGDIPVEVVIDKQGHVITKGEAEARKAEGLYKRNERNRFLKRYVLPIAAGISALIFGIHYLRPSEWLNPTIKVAQNYIVPISANLDGIGDSDDMVVVNSVQEKRNPAGFINTGNRLPYLEFQKVELYSKNLGELKDLQSKVEKVSSKIPVLQGKPNYGADTSDIIYMFRWDLDGDGERDWIFLTEDRRESYPYVFITRNGTKDALENLLGNGKLSKKEIENIEMNKHLALQGIPYGALPKPRNKR